MVSSSGVARLALTGLLGLVALSGCTVVVGAVLDGKDSDGGVAAVCTSDPMCDDGNPCTEDRCPDGRCVRTVVAEGTPCIGDGMCRMGVCTPCPVGGCGPRCPMVPCMGDDMCVDGACVPFVCSDARPCPPGKVCDDAGTCVSAPTPCGDGVVDVAMGEECEPPGFGDCLPNCMWRCIDASNCDDSDPCTTDICDPVSDCMWTPGVDEDMDGYQSVACGGNDCKDTDAAVHLGALEICNTVDDDCDGMVDNAVIATSWYPDVDMDGFGDSGGTAMVITGCTPPIRVADNNLDCYDRNPAVHPYDAGMAGGVPFFPTDRGDGSFDYDCDGTQRRELGAPDCTSGGTNACGTGETSCTGAPGILATSPVCGMSYTLTVCASCRTATAPCGRVSSGTTVILKCN